VSDARRRLLEREAAHDPAAAERVLVDRWRAGELDPLRVNLAAELGHDGAARLIGLDRAPRKILLHGALSRIVQYMSPGGHPQFGAAEQAVWREAAVLAACGLCSVAQAAYHDALRRRGSRNPHAKVFRVGGVPSCSDPTCDLALRSIEAAREWAGDHDLRPARTSLTYMIAHMGLTGRAQWIVGASAMVDGAPEYLLQVYLSALAALDTGEDGSVLCHPDALDEAVREWVVPWCLS
jgi:hypothetical protein